MEGTSTTRLIFSRKQQASLVYTCMFDEVSYHIICPRSHCSLTPKPSLYIIN